MGTLTKRPVTMSAAEALVAKTLPRETISAIQRHYSRKHVPKVWTILGAVLADLEQGSPSSTRPGPPAHVIIKLVDSQIRALAANANRRGAAYMDRRGGFGADDDDESTFASASKRPSWGAAEPMEEEDAFAMNLLLEHLPDDVIGVIAEQLAHNEPSELKQLRAASSRMQRSVDAARKVSNVVTRVSTAIENWSVWRDASR